jgi:ABC-type nickel/cobalt efflux system permease component RcnA
MRRILTYVLAGLGIVAGFCLAFTIIVVLVVKDGDTSLQLTEAWMPYISLILVIALPAVIVWAIFRFGRNLFFKNLRKHTNQKKEE